MKGRGTGVNLGATVPIAMLGRPNGRISEYRPLSNSRGTVSLACAAVR